MSAVNLVTGANGHLGNNLVRTLLDRGTNVRASVRDPTNTEPFEGLSCEIVQAELMDKASLLRALEGVETLYHVAAVMKHWSRDPEADIIRPTIEGTRNVLEAAARHGVSRIVFVSSEITLKGHTSPVDETSWRSDDCGNPYAKAKIESERLAWRLADELDLDMVSVLPGAFVGPNSFRLTPTMKYLQRALKGEVFLDVNAHLNFVDVRDVAAGMIAAADRGKRGERYILATEESISTRRIVELAREFNPDVKIPPRAPRWALLALGGLMELAARVTGKEPMVIRSQVRIFYGNERRIDLSKPREELGYEPRDPEAALREAFEYLNQAGTQAASA